MSTSCAGGVGGSNEGQTGVRTTYCTYRRLVVWSSTTALCDLRCDLPFICQPPPHRRQHKRREGPGQLTTTCQLSCYLEVWPALVPSGSVSTRHVHMFEHKISLRRRHHWHPRPVPLLAMPTLVPASKSPASPCINMPFVHSVTRPRRCCRMSALSPRKPSK